MSCKRFALAALLLLASVANAAAPSKWTIHDLLSPWGGMAQAVNNRGEVTGWMYAPPGSSFHHAFIWSNGAIQDLGVPNGQYATDASGMSNNGWIVGNTGNGWPMLWHNGDWTVLSVHGQFNDVNESGTAVGGIFFPGFPDNHAASYKDGVLTDLGTMGGGWSVAWAVNNSGTIVGNASLPTPPFSGLHKYRGFVYENGAMRDIGTLGGTSSYAYDINNAGLVVGASDTASGRMVATVYQNGVLRPLTEIPGNSAARAVNERGDVIGSSDDGGWLYSDGVLTMLAQIPAVRAAGYASITPLGINDRGWITGTGYKPATGGQSFVLIPK